MGTVSLRKIVLQDFASPRAWLSCVIFQRLQLIKSYHGLSSHLEKSGWSMERCKAKMCLRPVLLKVLASRLSTSSSLLPSSTRDSSSVLDIDCTLKILSISGPSTSCKVSKVNVLAAERFTHCTFLSGRCLP